MGKKKKTMFYPIQFKTQQHRLLNSCSYWEILQILREPVELLWETLLVIANVSAALHVNMHFCSRHVSKSMEIISYQLQLALDTQTAVAIVKARSKCLVCMLCKPGVWCAKPNWVLIIGFLRERH